MAKSFNPPNDAEFDEYKQVGNIGLWKAAQNFRPSTGNAFSTMAWYCIRNEIIRYIKKQKKHISIAIDNTSLENIDLEPTNNSSNLSEYLPNYLTKEEKTVLKLRVQGYTFLEIGVEMGGLTKNNVGNIFKNASKKVRIANLNV